jgi:Mn2+/Fe2+ NRAMP family transporter
MRGSKPDLGNLVSGILHPVLPTGETSFSPWVVIMGVLAATMGSISSLRYSAAVLEKGWRSTAFLRQQRIDLMLSVQGMFAIFALMQIAAAGALQPRGIQLKRLEDIAPIFSNVFGSGGVLLFVATLWSVTFSGSVATGSSYVAVNLVTVPVIALMILRLTSDRKIMGAHVNHWFANVVLVFAVLCALFLSGQGLLDLIRGN